MKINGLDKLLRDIDRLENKAEDDAMIVINENVDKMIIDARSNAPKDLGRLIDSIDKEKNGDSAVYFYVGEDYGAFQEFGTGTYVKVPNELADVAQDFKGYKSGNWSEFYEAIKDWCLRQGIPENAAYPIAMSILRKGLKPQPYFYPAFLKNKDNILTDLEKRLERSVSRI